MRTVLLGERVHFLGERAACGLALAMARITIPDGPENEIIRMWGANPAMGGVAGSFSAKAYEKSQVAVRERELVRMRIAQINQCLT